MLRVEIQINFDAGRGHIQIRQLADKNVTDEEARIGEVLHGDIVRILKTATAKTKGIHIVSDYGKEVK